MGWGKLRPRRGGRSAQAGLQKGRLPAEQPRDGISIPAWSEVLGGPGLQLFRSCDLCCFLLATGHLRQLLLIPPSRGSGDPSPSGHLHHGPSRSEEEEGRSYRPRGLGGWRGGGQGERTDPGENLADASFPHYLYHQTTHPGRRPEMGRENGFIPIGLGHWGQFVLPAAKTPVGMLTSVTHLITDLS